MDRDKIVKDSNKGQLSLKNDSLSGFLSGSPVAVFIFKKTQKFVAGLFILTELFEKDNPFRLKIRHKATDLLSDSILLAGGKESRIQTTPFRNRSLELLFFLESAYFAGFVSEMNLKIFQSEYLPILTLLEEALEDGTLTSSAISSHFFDAAPSPYKGHIGHDKGQNVRYVFDKKSTPPTPSMASVDKIDQTKTNFSLESPRIKALLSFIKRHDEVSVKDAATVVSGVSEKTVQRDLLALVARGVLKKKGERRWSRYSLT